MLETAVRQWWVLVLQGVLGIAVGVIAIAYPDIALVTLALLYGAWAIVTGVTTLAIGWRVASDRGRSLPFLVTGAVSLIAGVIAILLPGVTIITLALLVGAWLGVAGVMEIYTAWRIRDEISNEWILIAVGVLRLAAGALILYQPVIGAVVTVALFATWSILGGAAALVLGWRLRQLGGTPATA
jgi:uncharacterized membrane protein HdeD (DUF308 family)